RREVAIATLAVCAIVAGIAGRLHLEPLLAATAAGLVVENLGASAGDLVEEAVERSSLPVLIVFFAAAGASLDLDALAVLGWAAAAIAAWRLLTIWVAARTGRAAAALTDATSAMAWMAMVSQAGVTLGLTFIVAAEFPAWGARLQTLMLARIAPT